MEIRLKAWRFSSQRHECYREKRLSLPVSVRRHVALPSPLAYPVPAGEDQ